MRRLYALGVGVGVLLVLVGLVLPALADDDDEAAEAIAKANAKIEKIVLKTVEKLEKAKSFKEMEKLADKAEAKISDIIADLEEKIGPVEYEPFYVTVCNDKVGKCVTFDPVHVTGSGNGR